MTAVLLDATRGALRLRVEGRSTARGSLPACLSGAADFEIVGIEAGSTLLVVEAATLLEAAQPLFAQQALFEVIDSSDSAFGVMEQTLRVFLGQNDPYSALETTLEAEISEEAWPTLKSDTSRPFPKPANGRIAVKVINPLGDKVMEVFRT